MKYYQISRRFTGGLAICIIILFYGEALGFSDGVYRSLDDLIKSFVFHAVLVLILFAGAKIFLVSRWRNSGIQEEERL